MQHSPRKQRTVRAASARIEAGADCWVIAGWPGAGGGSGRSSLAPRGPLNRATRVTLGLRCWWHQQLGTGCLDSAATNDGPGTPALLRALRVGDNLGAASRS
jgi:hypothetical protein